MNRELLRYTDIEKPDYIPNGKIFRILFDSSMNMMRIVCHDNKLLDCMRDAFSDINQSAFYISMYGFKSDEKVYLINAFGYFMPGLLFDIIEYIKIHYGNLSVVYMSEQCKEYINDYLTPIRKYIKNYSEESFNVLNISDDSGRNSRVSEDEILKFRDYQREAIKACIFKGYCRCLMELPTSSGKSFLIANLIYNIEKQIIHGLKYLIFVPNTQLVSQFYKDLIEYGFDKKYVTQLVANGKGESKYNPDANIIISNRQYLFKNKDKIPNVDVLINDEVHQSKPKTATIDIIDNLNCKMKIGLSGTLPRGKYEKLSLIGSFGRVIFVETITNLQNKGFISKLEINTIEIFDKTVESDRSLPFHVDSFRKFKLGKQGGLKFNEAFDLEIAYINENYQKLYSPIISEIEKLNGNTLVLFDRIEFGQNMYELTKNSLSMRNVMYIDGQTNIKERELARQTLEKNSNNILFGQCSILSTGINIKNLTNLVMMVSTKSFSRILQSIGRTLRLHKDKDVAKLYDLSFNFKYSQKHLEERLAIYKKMYKKTPDNRKIINV